MDDLNKWIRWTKPVGGRTDANLNVHLRTIREGDFSSVETVPKRLGKAIDAIWKTRADKGTQVEPVGKEAGTNPPNKEKERPIQSTNERKKEVPAEEKHKLKLTAILQLHNHFFKEPQIQDDAEIKRLKAQVLNWVRPMNQDRVNWLNELPPEIASQYRTYLRNLDGEIPKRVVTKQLSQKKIK